MAPSPQTSPVWSRGLWVSCGLGLCWFTCHDQLCGSVGWLKGVFLLAVVCSTPFITNKFFAGRSLMFAIVISSCVQSQLRSSRVPPICYHGICPYSLVSWRCVQNQFGPKLRVHVQNQFGAQIALQYGDSLAHFPRDVHLDMLRFSAFKDLVSVGRCCRTFGVSVLEDGGETLSLSSLSAKISCRESCWPRLLISPVGLDAGDDDEVRWDSRCARSSCN